MEHIRLPDVQNKKAEIPIQLSRVGVTNVEKIVVVRRRAHEYQFPIQLQMFVVLDNKHKGVNMSRFLDTIESVDNICASVEQYAIRVAEENKKRHNGARSFVRIRSKFPMKIKRPDGKVEIRLIPFEVSYDTENRVLDLGVTVLGMAYCPCGKEMCSGPSHNQRSEVKINIKLKRREVLFDAGNLVKIADASFSTPIYGRLKRPHEKEVILKAMNNPKFSEDICREVVNRLNKKVRSHAGWAEVKVTNFESIHPHNCVSEWRGILY